MHRFDLDLLCAGRFHGASKLYYAVVAEASIAIASSMLQ